MLSHTNGSKSSSNGTSWTQLGIFGKIMDSNFMCTLDRIIWNVVVSKYALNPFHFATRTKNQINVYIFNERVPMCARFFSLFFSARNKVDEMDAKKSRCHCYLVYLLRLLLDGFSSPAYFTLRFVDSVFMSLSTRKARAWRSQRHSNGWIVGQ